MTPITRPRGPLPARVYWTRRLLLLVLVLGLVFGAARLLGGGGSGEAGPSATPVAADPTSTPTTLGPSPTPTAASAIPTPAPTPTVANSGATPSATGTRAGAPASVLAAPSGTCENSDVVVVPSVASPAYAVRPVILTLSLTTKVSPACNWVVSPDNLVVKVTSGDSRFWSTQDCVGAVPKQAVVVRSEAPTTVSMAWNGLRSDADCSRSTSWAEPGYYHVVAAAFGAEPTDVQFRLFAPVRKTITATPTPSPSPSEKATRRPNRR